MYKEIVDIIYENEGVEGIAIFNDLGNLVVNQLALNEEALVKIGASLTSIRSGLEGVSREILGFVLKTDNYLLQAIIQREVTFLLEITPGYSVTETYSSVKSQIGMRHSAPASSTNTLSPQTQELPAIVKAEPAKAEPVKEVEDGSVIDWQEFRNSLLLLIKRVAPSGVANKMITAASVEFGILAEQEVVSFDKANAIGLKVVNKIPNASRRKLIANEYKIMVKQYDI